MKNLYTLTALLCLFAISGKSQNYPMETVGTPSNTCMAETYNGWANTGLLVFNGNSEVQNVNSSNNLNASGGGNVFFTNTPGTFLQISGFNPANSPATMDISFSMYGYNVNNLSELVLEYSTDGINYTALPYKRLFRNYLPPTPWDVMVSDPLPAAVGFTSVKLRFRQTSSTQQFRIDDIETNFYSALPVHLLNFSAFKLKSDVQVNWTVRSVSDKEVYVLERGNDGRHFTPVATMNATGVGEFAYTYTDISTGDKTFYRLKLTDADGKTAYSQIIFIQPVIRDNRLIQSVYPVPARDRVNTQVVGNSGETAQVMLTDMSGRVVRMQQFNLATGFNNCALDVQGLHAGAYVLRISSGARIETKTILVQ